MDMAKQYVYFGSWGAREHSGNGKGIYYGTLDTESGVLEYVGANTEVPDCGIICMSADCRYIYATNELSRYFTMDEDGVGGGVTALAIRDADGYPNTINSVRSLGSMPNNVSIDPKGKFVFVSNHATFGVSTQYRKVGDQYKLYRTYDKTSVAMLPVNEDGSLGEVCDLVYANEKGSAHAYGHDYEKIDYGYRGNCPVSPFHLQGSSHLHCAAADQNGFVVACNRGSDKLYLFEIDYDRSKLVKRDTFRCRLGLGPRHAAFHPEYPCFYVVNEIESTILVFHIDRVGKQIKLIGTVSVLPKDKAEDTLNMPSDIKIAPNGKYVYCTNRYENSVSVFEIALNGEKLHLIQYVSLPGSMPRGFGISPAGRHLLVGLADNNEVVAYPIGVDGKLGDIVGRINVPTPTSVVFGKIAN